jgi:hypothetical protein
MIPPAAPETSPRHVTEGLTILWRGELSGCNYACGYCPFAKRKDTRRVLAQDRADLERFCTWVETRDYPVSILFTPWGEALVRKYYREAVIRLSHTDNVSAVAIQTNLSFPVDWMAACDLDKAALWTTYHPGQVAREAFLTRVDELMNMGARFSVGMVALREHFDEIAQMRANLPAEIYLWINAEDRLQGRYTKAEIERLVAIDPLFELNNRVYRTLGRACGAGETAISVSGNGDATPCHFVGAPIGNIYDEAFESLLTARACPRSTCNCHIGYSHMPALDMRGLFGDGFLERRAHMPAHLQAAERLAAFAATRAPQVSLTG